MTFAQKRRCATNGNASAMRKVTATSAPNAVPKSASAAQNNPVRPCAGRHHRTIVTFKIKAADLKRMEEGLDALSAERARLGDAVGVFNEALATARATLQAAVDDYNQKAKDARAHFEYVHRDLEKAYDERSDDWKDGEKGTAVKEWLDTLESFPENIVDVSLDEFIDELELEDLLGDDPMDDFNDLDKEPGEA